MQLNLPDNLTAILDAWRRNQKAETGKLPTRSGAICTLLSRSLDGVEEVSVPTARELDRRLSAVEEYLKTIFPPD